MLVLNLDSSWHIVKGNATEYLAGLCSGYLLLRFHKRGNIVVYISDLFLRLTWFMIFTSPLDWTHRSLSHSPPLSVLCGSTRWLFTSTSWPRLYGHMRAHAESYVTVLAPLLARWLKRRRKEHGKTCERSVDFSERQLLFLMYFF